VPAEIAWSRRKIGYSAPDVEFLRAMCPTLRDMFSGGLRSREFVDSHALDVAMSRPEAMPAYLWRFLNFELWMREFNVSI
jgi:hypothetical protein